ncbi:MAG TPA: TonB-dependent receptor [Phenylobacterium sp.]|jgi:outer membrane receptor protein involved in Fe transport|nr:TonB-dependent receptor [Phenylobacterium sp.]
MTGYRTNQGRRLWLMAGLATAALAAATLADAGPAQTVRIAAGPLDAALRQLAAETNEQLLFSPEMVAGRRAPAVVGKLTTEEALAQLLASTDISVTRVGPAVLVLRSGHLAQKPAATTPPGTAREGQAGHPFAAEPGAGGQAGAPAATPHAPPSPVADAVSEVEITGSHIRGAAAASPLLVISRSDLERSGQSTVAGALNALPQNFGGVDTEGTVSTGADALGRNTSYATGVNLRGLGSDATLVLVNGRRLAGSGAFGDFADISAIPTAAVERVEVLLDGASAIYGSDAVGGVVNIILRKDFQGAETRLETGVATAGQPSEFQASQTLGRRWTGGGVLFSYEYQQRGALPGDARDFTTNADLRPLGGTDHRVSTSFPGNILGVNPVTGVTGPAFAIPAGQNGVGLLPGQLQAGVVNLENQRLGIDTLPSQALHSVYLAFDQDVGDRLQITADARYSHRAFDTHLMIPTSNFTVTRANPFFVAPSAGTASETVSYSFAGDLPNPTQTGSAATVTGTLGATLRLVGDWRAEGYLAIAQESDHARSQGLINSSALSEAVGSVPDRPQTAFNTAVNGFFNPFSGTPGSNNPAVLAYIAEGFSSTKSRDQVSSADLQADGSLWTLPGGAIKLALGAQARHEELLRTGVNFGSTVTPAAQQPTNASRDVTAAFVEMQIPLVGPDNARPGVQRLDLSVAGRMEHYSDFGTTTNPKVGLIWVPADGVTLRASYGTSFRAPALREIFDHAVDSPILLPVAGGQVRALLMSGGNTSLQPETATSWTGGVDFKPARWPGLSVSLTGFDVKFANRIDLPVTRNIAGALTDPTLASFVTRISPTTSAADLATITALVNSPQFIPALGVFAPTAYGAIVDNRYVNTSELRVRGLDLQARYAFDLGGDRVVLGGNATYLVDYDQQITPTSALLNEVDVANFPVRLRSRLTADWIRDRLTLGAAFNYIGAYHDALGVRIGDQPTVDLQARLAPAETGLMRGVTVTFNIRNVFDRAPPFYDNFFGVGYDPANADPIGRFVSLQLTRAW